MPDISVLNASTVPRVRKGIDIVRAGLSQDEGWLVSRVDGRTSVKELSLLLNQSMEAVVQLVDRLMSAGVLVTDKTETEDVEGYDSFIFSSEALNEAVDLSVEEKKRILYTHAHLDQWTHYQILGVRWRDSAKAVKKAYYERSKEWHPDRFRRPQLGSYQERIEEIFRAVRNAYGVLSNPTKKAQYDVQHAPSFDEDDMAEILAARRGHERNIEREEERRRRRLARNPLRQRMLRAKALYQQALELEAKGELLEAMQMAQAASALDNREVHQELRSRLQVATAEVRVAPLMRRGLHAESMTSWADAVKVFREAVRVAPDHGPARLRLAYNLLMGGLPPQSANEHIQVALQKMPNDPETHFVRGLAYEKVQMDKAAVGAFQRAIELKPNYTEAKKRLKKLRWGF